MALYAEYDYKNDDETINKIALAIGRKPKTAQKMIAGGMRNMMFADFYRRYADEDGEEGAEDVTVDTNTEPARMFYNERRLKTLCEAFNNLEYRERAIVAEHLGFCENCWSTRYVEVINGKKVKRIFKKTAFIDLAGEHGVVPSSADRIYRGAIDKLRKALEDDRWLYPIKQKSPTRNQEGTLDSEWGSIICQCSRTGYLQSKKLAKKRIIVTFE